MAEFPALPLWTDAYLADCSHLSDVENGRYLMMLIHMWRAPDRRFPNDDEWLARKFCRFVEQARTELRPLLAEFFKTDGNWLWHKRLEREWNFLQRQSVKQRDRAKSRWEKEKALCRGSTTSGIAPTPLLKKESLTLTPESYSQRQSPVEAPDGAKPSPSGNGTYRWAGAVIRLNERSFDQWAASYHALDLPSQLQSLDDWLSSDAGEDKRKSWFQVVSGALRKRHSEAIVKSKREQAKSDADRKSEDEIPW